MLHEKTPKTLKNAKIFECISCDFKCTKQSDYNRHLLTRKHINATSATINATQKNSKTYICNCNKIFKITYILYLTITDLARL